MSDRQGNGRFTKGNKAAVGRSSQASKRLELGRALRAVVTPDEIAAIGRKLVELAKNGDIDAARLVLAYAIGQPPKHADEPKHVGLPELASPSDLPKIVVATFEALRRGEVDVPDVAALIEAAGDAAKVLEHYEVRRELDELRELIGARALG